MSPDDLKRKIEELQRRTDAASNKKAQLAGQLQAKKEELAAIIKEVKAAGFDPKNLLSERDKARAELEQLIAAYESDLQKTEASLAAYDKR